jgi:hypothetical protein
VVVPDTARPATGLECRIGRARIAVPVAAAVRVIEYGVVPLPLARPWIGGVGVHEGAPVISVALVAGESGRAGGAPSKGVLLNVPGSPIAWALEVHEAFTFVRVTVQPRRKEATDQLPCWITGADTHDGRSLGWIHVSVMLADLAQIVEHAQ